MRVELTVVEGPHSGKAFCFDHHENFVVGRATTAQFRLPAKDQFFSRNHFLIEVNPPLCRLLDLNSRNGTFVNGKRVSRAELKDGDLIKGGETVLRVGIAAPQVAESPPVDVHPARDARKIIAPRIQRTPHDKRPTPPAAPTPASTVVRPLARQPTAADRKKAAAIRQPFPGYQLVEEIGQGGMGVVFKAISLADNSLAALKLVRPAVAVDAQDIARFLREVEILKAFSHAHVVPFRDVGHTEGLLYFVMDFVDGVDATHLLHESPGSLPVGRAIRIACQLLEALTAAHRLGFVHRDVKPSNLLLERRDGENHVWLVDFGLARAYQSSRISGLTMTGDFGGTTPFMAPEQITNFRNVGPAADQYSVAATLYHLLTGKYVYDFPKDVAKQLLKILQEPTIPIEQRRSNLPRELAAAIKRALSREPERRFPDAEAFGAALAAINPSAS